MLATSKNDPQNQELLNTLKTQILDYQESRLNRWFQVIGIVLAFFALALPVAGFLGLQGFRELQGDINALPHEVAVARNEVERIFGRVREIEAKMTAVAANLPSQLEAAEAAADKLAQDTDLAATAVAEAAAVTDVLTSLLPDQDFESYGSTKSGSLTSGTSRRETFSLSPGEYRFTADCDENCDDLDLMLYRADDEEPVDEDLLLDAFPIVSFEADTLEDVVLEVVMVECSEEPCTWNLDVYRRD